MPREYHRTVSYTVDDNGCWVWDGCKTKYGYGFIRVKGKNLYAHRYYYEQALGEIPEGMTIDHLCRNTSCVNPEHMEPVTKLENSRRAAKKLTREQAIEIRERALSGKCSQVSLAKEYGVSTAAVSRIKDNKLWKDI